MRELSLGGKSGRCRILIGEKLANLAKYCGSTKIAIITGKSVSVLHSKNFPQAEVIEIGNGEGAKTLETAASIYRRFLALELDRSAFIVGIGGGVVCDVAGFVASTYLRGLRLGLVPTTLLAQSDAAIGGKNGVNLDSYKNLIGTFRQPEFCLIDFDFLKTLPEKELANGFAEVIKHAAIGSPGLLGFLEKNSAALLSGDATALEKAVSDSVAVKVKAVQNDELESGKRMVLNFGHTLGHAIEKTAKISHGQAVGIGMAAALRISVSKGLLKDVDASLVVSLIEKFGLPTKINFNRALVLDAIKKDKKRRGDGINMVLLRGIGKPIIRKISLEEIGQALTMLGG